MLEPRSKKEGKSLTKRPGSAKRDKTRNLEIHETVKVKPKNLPSGSTFKGYNDFVVQGLHIKPFNVRYRLERWESPDGQSFIGRLPAELDGSCFSPELRSFILVRTAGKG